MALGLQRPPAVLRARCSSSRSKAQPWSSISWYGNTVSPDTSSSMGRVCGQGIGVNTPICVSPSPLDIRCKTSLTQKVTTQLTTCKNTFFYSTINLILHWGLEECSTFFLYHFCLLLLTRITSTIKIWYILADYDCGYIKHLWINKTEIL